MVLRVMTFNLWADHPRNETWSKRRGGVLALLRKHEPHLIGFQEAVATRVDDLARELPQYAWVGVGRDDGAASGEFTPLFFQRDLLRCEVNFTFWLSPTPKVPSRGWNAACFRTATACEFTLPGTVAPAFLVINTHFDHFSRRARIESSRLVLDEINRWDAHRPAILLGDLNCSPSSASYRLITSAESAFHDCLRACPLPAEGPAYTWRGWRGAGIGKRRLDYIFARHFQVHHHAVLDEKVEGRYPSDHLPVLCDLEIKAS